MVLVLALDALAEPLKICVGIFKVFLKLRKDYFSSKKLWELSE